MKFVIQESIATVVPELPDGRYLAQVEWVDFDSDPKQIDWCLIQEPYEGIKLKDKFFTNHENPRIASLAKWILSKICVHIGGMKDGEEADTKELLGKLAWLEIKNKPGKKENTFFPNIHYREPYRDSEEVRPVEKAGYPHEPINDEVPF